MSNERCSALFIGGGNDGKWMQVEPLEIIKLPLPGEKQTGPNLQIEEYRLELLRTSKAEFAFYVSTTMTIEAAIRRLVRFYTPNRPTLIIHHENTPINHPHERAERSVG